MNTSLPRLLAALVALTFIVAACASDTGSEWTFVPVTAQQVTAETEPAATDAGEPEPAPASPGAAESLAAEPQPAASPAAAGEPRVIMLQADAALRFTDASGQPIQDIPVTPGETIRFQINNTAGFDHNFYIGTDEELSIPSATTEIGISDWSTGVQELDWVVPEDVTGLKFGCTIPGHYTLMQGTFSASAAAPAAEEPAPEPAAEPAPEPQEPVTDPAATAAADATAEPGDGEAVAAGDGRIIPLEADAALRFTQDGQQIREIPVTPGELVVFEIDNTAGFAHNFYIGTNEELMVPSATTETGISDWDSGVMRLEWVVPDDIAGLRFGCTVPGHYTLMQGDFVISP